MSPQETLAAYWASLAPYLYQQGVDKSVLNQVQKAATASKMSYVAVESALIRALDAAGHPKGLIGRPSFYSLNVGCPNSAAPRLHA